MPTDEVMAALKAAGSAQAKKTYQRHGVHEPLFGVSYAELGKLKKKIKVDKALAEDLWSTGNHDARILATMVADPATLSRKTLDAWAKAPDNYVLADALARLVAQTPHARTAADAWSASKVEFIAQSGWSVYAALAASGAGTDADWLGLLARVEAELNGAKNRVRHAMNSTVIAIGGRSAQLKAAALASAKRIGVVEVDHGDTDCETPDAARAIAKVWARKKA